MNVLLHIPHASLDVPDAFYDGLLIPREQFRKYNLEMTDLGIEELFRDCPYEKMVAPYSRLYCDVERFRDDSMEVMSKYGEGVVYTHTYDGCRFHFHDERYREEVLRYYDDYHRQLDDLTRKLLLTDDELLILDCHSFSDKMASHFFEPPFPDICIGTEPDFYDERIVNLVIRKIETLGYTYRLDYPYRGSLVPNCVYHREIPSGKRVVSVMLEINKRIYL